MIFTDKFKELMLDRVVIGGIVGVVVYFSTVQLEKNKADEAFNIAVNQMRVQKIAEVWEEAALFEEKFNDLYLAIDQAKFEIDFFRPNKATKELVYKRQDVINAADKFELAREEFLSKIRQNRFYLGKNLEEHIFRYHRELTSIAMLQNHSLSIAYEIDDYENLLKKSRAELSSFRADIDQVRRYFLTIE